MQSFSEYVAANLMNKRVSVLHTRSEVGSARLMGTITEVGSDFVVLHVGSNTIHLLMLNQIVDMEPKD